MEEFTSRARAVAWSESRTRLPEWFIGGPWHGQDKLARRDFADVGGQIVAHHTSGDPLPLSFYPGQTGPEIKTTLYCQRKYAFGRTVFKIWVADDLDEAEAATQLAEILLAPHYV